jgi:hypothetical protein
MASKAAVSVQERAQEALTERLSEILSALPDEPTRPGLDPRGYLTDGDTGQVPFVAADVRRLARFGTVATISSSELARGLTQLAGGVGSELSASAAKRPKFLAAYSSSALALNIFGPFLDGRTLVLGGQALQKPKLEAILKIGVKCGRPNLDLLSRNDNAVVAVESKCTEQLKPKTRVAATDFATLQQRPDGDPYAPRTRTLAAGPGAVELYELLAADPCAFRHVDATQLLKHYLGLRNTHGTNACTLLYLYWEPENAADLEVCGAHAEEVERVGAYLTDRSVTFKALTTTALWESWIADENPFLARHAGALQRRYVVPV